MTPKMSIITKSDAGKLLFVLIFSLIIAYFAKETSVSWIFYMLPTILGILLAGVLASLAIIFGLLSSNELAKLYKRSMEVKNKDIYEEFLGRTKIDAKIIFLSFCFSIVILLVSNIEQLASRDLAYIGNPLWILLGLGVFWLFMSISAEYDIIMSLFHLNQIRYELLKKDKTETAMEEAVRRG